MKTSFVRALLTVLAPVIMIGLGVAPSASADGVETTVYPTGVYPQDLQNVQAAVDLGGTILLRATDAAGVPTAFNFGPPFQGSDNVLLTSDVTSLGEMVGGYMTTIVGGQPPFLGALLVQSTIRGIHFDGPGIAALFLVRSTGAEFSSNRVTEVIGLPEYLPGISKGQAVWATSYDPDSISGQIVIVDNLIEGINAELGYGLALASFGAETHIVRNEIRGVNSSGIIVFDNTQPVWIEDNLIVPGPARYPGTVDIGNGISAVLSLGGAFFIRGNTVGCENPLSDGIQFGGNELIGVEHSVMEGNHVMMHDSFYAGIALYGNVQGATVQHNLIEGTGAFALQVALAYSPEEIAASNTFVGNNIATFQSQIADLFLDVNSYSTVVVGLSGEVIDLGEQNSITGYTRIGMSEPIGQQIQDAQLLKQEMWGNLQLQLP